MNHVIIYFLFLFILEPPFKVEYRGALMDIMHKGDLSAKADLRDLEDVDHLYALGALENLKGEILILDGKPYISREEEEEVAIEESFMCNASLLVYASVENWQSVEVATEVRSKDELAMFIAQTAESSGLDITEPFPFLLIGNIRSIDWHVINWEDGDTEHSHEKHIHSGPHGTLLGNQVEILGFYSDSHHAIFTHHSTNMHMHFVTDDRKLSGHIDDLIPGEGLILSLPLVRS
jgi:acetolactate decarboxylase